MRLPRPVRSSERTSRTQAQPSVLAGAVTPSLTGDCYDNATCTNSILPGRGRVQRNSTVDGCQALVGNNGAWKAAIQYDQPEECFPLATSYTGMKQRENLKVGLFR